MTKPKSKSAKKLSTSKSRRKLATSINSGGRVYHVVVGNEEWQPTQEELENYADLFMEAFKDPEGGIVVTCSGVQVFEVASSILGSGM